MKINSIFKRSFWRLYEARDLLIIISFGLIPLLWYTPGQFIANGDHFPYIFNLKPQTDSYLWSPTSLGNPSPAPAFVLFGYLVSLFQSLTQNIGVWQIILYLIQFEVASISMYYLAKLVYPNARYTAVTASALYIFNFFLLSILLNIGMMWTYSILPILIALLMKILTQSSTLKEIFYFSLAFTVVGSISSMNFANIILIIIVLGSVLVYHTLIDPKIPRRTSVTKLLIVFIITFLLSIWWIIPNLNYYLFSTSTQIHQDIDITSWSWSHNRASFLNLFQLNGFWGWLPEYTPFYSFYSNTVLTVFLVLPFLIASIALHYKTRHTQYNLYLMLVLLVFMFLAKGIHEPLSEVNYILYKYIPYMNMFREPVSKFTLIMIPFLALLVGFTVDQIVMRCTCHRLRKYLKFFPLFVILVFSVSTLPLFLNPIERKTTEIPYSSYTAIPTYWYECSEWLSNMSADSNILVTPIDDYYQVSYDWGYYGSDTFIERLFPNSVISPCYTYNYIVNPNTVTLLNLLRNSIENSWSDQFQELLNLLNIKYIVHRNDLDYVYLEERGREIHNPIRIQEFLLTQKHLTRVKVFGKLDIFENIHNISYIHILEPLTQEYSIDIVRNTVFSQQWNFNRQDQLIDWDNINNDNISLENMSLRIELEESTLGWKSLAFPLIPIKDGIIYNLKFDIRGLNAHQVHVKIFEYDTKMNVLYSKYSNFVADGTFEWRNIQLDHTVMKENATFLQLQVWHGHETDKPLPNIIWVDNVVFEGFSEAFNTTLIQEALKLNASRSIVVTNYTKIEPTYISVNINAKEPFTFAITEAYDPSWLIQVNERSIKSFSIYSIMTGVQINETGLLQVTLKYQPQDHYRQGVSVSICTLIGYIICQILFPSIKSKSRF